MAEAAPPTPDQTSPPVAGPDDAAVSPDPAGDGQAPDAGDAGDGDASVEDAEAVARAAALALLAAGFDPAEEVSPGGSEDAPAPSPRLNGTVREWGGDVRYVVLGYHFQSRVGDVTEIAYRGDVITTTAKHAERGLEFGSLQLLDD